MELQLRPQRPAGFNLSADVVLEIFDWFKDENLYNARGVLKPKYRRDPNAENFKTIQALRLVCRGFCRLASPLLLPVLHVEISTESLHRAEQLTRNPDIASGVRLIKVCLAYRSRRIAEDPTYYKKRQLQMLCHLRSYIGHSKMFPFDRDRRKTPKDGILHDLIVAAFNEVAPDSPKRPPLMIQMDSDSDGVDRDMDPDNGGIDAQLSTRPLLTQCYDEYYHKYLDQERILNTFASSLAASISRLLHIQALAFDNTPNHRFEQLTSERYNNKGTTIRA